MWGPVLHCTGYRVPNILLQLLQDRVQHLILQCVLQHTPDNLLQPVLPAEHPGARLHLHQRGAGGGLHSGGQARQVLPGLWRQELSPGCGCHQEGGNLCSCSHSLSEKRVQAEPTAGVQAGPQQDLQPEASHQEQTGCQEGLWLSLLFLAFTTRGLPVLQTPRNQKF